MNTIEDFENAPIGATATHDDGSRALKTYESGRSWLTSWGSCLSDQEMTQRGYTLDQPAPTTAREAVDLAWDLAHEVREGQVIPEGAWLVERRDDKITVEKNTFLDIAVDEWGAENFRTFDPLPEPELDWIDAPAVIAATDDCPELEVWVPKSGGYWKCSCCRDESHWSELRDVTPLCRKKV